MPRPVGWDKPFRVNSNVIMEETLSAARVTCQFKRSTGDFCKRSVAANEIMCWQHARSWNHKWKSLTRNQTVAFIGLLASVLLGLAGVYLAYPSWRSERKNSATELTATSSSRDGGNSSAGQSTPANSMAPPVPLGGLPLKSPPTPVPQPTKPRPELFMSFVNPKNPEFRIENRSGIVIEHAKYWFGLVDLDQPYLNSTPNLTGTVTPYAPLRIPSQDAGFINPKEVAGALVLPEDLVQRIKSGDRIFGVAQLECPGCEDRGYWLYVKYGYDGWFSEMKGHTAKGLEMPIPVENTDEQLEKLVPPAMRTRILPETRRK
jgi:hypothetical protein